MVHYSKEFLQGYYDSEWLGNYNLVGDDGYSPEEIEALYEKALSFELLKQNIDRKRIALPATAYLKLDAYEKAFQRKAESSINSARPLASYTLAPEAESLFGGWGFHDCLLIGLKVKGRQVEVFLNDVNAGQNPKYVSLIFSDAMVLENELPTDLETVLGAGGIQESDYWWIYEEAIINDAKKKELHVMVDYWYSHKKLAIQYDSVNVVYGES